MSIFRDCGSGLHVFNVLFRVDFQSLKRILKYRGGIPYKYLVYSPRADTSGNPYEYLYGAPAYDSGKTNRLLKISEASLEQGGIVMFVMKLTLFCFDTIANIRQFDTMVFPEVKDRRNIIGRVFEFFSGSSEFKVPAPSQMRTTCMEIHLSPTRNILVTGEYIEKFEFAVDGCVGLFHCGYVQYCDYYGGEREWVIKESIDVSIEM